jgi:hypothetical protein
MGRFSQEELEEAYHHYFTTCQRSAEEWDWTHYANLFTPDAIYVETYFGRFEGRDAIREWIVKTMNTPPYDEMRIYPHEWHAIDANQGWIICSVWNQMTDPGDQSVHREINWSKCVYAGDHQWSFQEDIYNPIRFAKMIERWREAKERHQSRRPS